MAGDVVIRAEGLGKKYLIGHRAERERYATFRDLVVRSARDFARTAADSFWAAAGLSPAIPIEEFWALKDVNFEIRRGEVVGIIGRNGAGKCTLLKILSRITEPTTGEVDIDGRVGEPARSRHRLSSRADRPREHLSQRRDPRHEARAKSTASSTRSSPSPRWSSSSIRRSSAIRSGMYVRLAFAVAAHLEPEILIVDEVLAVGDAEFQKKCLGKMSEVATGGRTVLFVSHNLGAVGTLCERCILLARGPHMPRMGGHPKWSLNTWHRTVPDKYLALAGLLKNRRSLLRLRLWVKAAHNNCVYWSNNFLLQIDYRAVNLPGLELTFILI